jgi:hypothetical protein
MKTTTKPLNELSETELQAELKKRKANLYWSCGYIGFMIGVAVYATVRNGFGFLSFLPVFFFPIWAPASKNYKEVKLEVERRRLNVER